MSKLREKEENCQRVSVVDAAKEMGCTPDYLRWLMREKKVDLGIVIVSSKAKRKRCEYMIFRSKLDKFLGLEKEGQ